MAIGVEPLDAPVGAVVSGVDGRRSLSDRDFHRIEQALLEHLVVVIPDLEDDVDWLLKFGRRFGPLVPHILTRFHHMADDTAHHLDIVGTQLGDGSQHEGSGLVLTERFREPPR